MIEELKEELRGHTRARDAEREENRREWRRVDTWNSGVETRVFTLERELDNAKKTLLDFERRLAALENAAALQQKSTTTTPSSNEKE